ncbi:MAG: hypothetical protein Q7L07_04310 [Pseudohongiella sp.]|nr:hypothetical protein [Pseudohongiella sp.]
MKHGFWHWVLLLCVVAASTPVQAQSVDFSGDLRFGYISFDRDERNGSTSDDAQWRVRVRAGMLWTINDTWTFKGRYSARVHDSRNRSGFVGLFEAMGSGGPTIAPGQTAVDEFFVRARYGKWDHRLGRFQTNSRLIGLASKSFSRTNSTGWDVGWTDGIQSTYRADHGVNYTAIIERNDKDGPSNLRRSPLRFDKSASRAGYYLGLDAAKTDGFWAQRSLDLTYIPSALYFNGMAAGQQRDYLGLSGRLATRVTIHDQIKLVSGIQLAWAPQTQRLAAADLPGTGDAKGTGWQLSFNVIDVVPGQNISMNYGQNEAGWLLSTDFVGNQSVAEIRHSWFIRPGRLLETRIHQRKDLNRLSTAVRKRVETDMYLRYSISF